MNTSIRGQVVQGGIVMPNYIDHFPESKRAFVSREAKQEAYARAFVRVASSLHYNVYKTGIPTWEVLTDDSSKLSALLAMNSIMLSERARMNKERALRNKQVELIERTRQINLQAQKAAQEVPTAPQLVRTVSAPVNEGLRLIGQPPVNPPQEMVTVAPSGALIIHPGHYNQAIRTLLVNGAESQKFLKEQAEKAANPQKEVTTMKLPKEAFQAGCIFKRPSPQPGTSTQVVTRLVKTPGSPNQEQQGRNTQSLTMDEIRERVKQIEQKDALRKVACQSVNIKKLTRAQLNKLTTDPEIKEQVLKHNLN